MKLNNEIEIRSLIGDLHIESREEGTVSRMIIGYAVKFESWSDPIMGRFREKMHGERSTDAICRTSSCVSTTILMLFSLA